VLLASATMLGAADAHDYEHDGSGNVTRIADPTGGETVLVYDEVDRLVSRTLPSGVESTWGYDLRDRVTSVVHTRVATGEVLASRHYVRSASGEPTRITGEDGSWVELGYDGAVRLTSETYHDATGAVTATLTYAYDADGNRTTRTVDTVTEGYGYAPGARLTEVTVGGVPTAGLGYDAAGRTTFMTRAGADYALRYDPDGHVTAVDDAGVPLSEYGFDGEGRRDTVTHDGTTRRYLEAPLPQSYLDGPHAVLDDTGTPLAVYVYAGDEPLMRIDPATGEATYYLADPEGSVIALADAAGAPTARLRYDGFGDPRGSSALPAGTLGDFRFHGMWLDPTGLYHVRARSYDPVTGRFLSRDPAEGDPQRPETFGAYAFANGNPYVWRDVTGRYSLAELSTSLEVQVQLHLVALARAALLTCELVAMIDAGTGTATGEGVCYKRRERDDGRTLYHYTDNPKGFEGRGAITHTWWTNVGTLTPSRAFLDLGIGRPGSDRGVPTHVVQVQQDDRFREGPRLPAGIRQWFNTVGIPPAELTIRPL